jgi:hypothetical protein
MATENRMRPCLSTSVFILPFLVTLYEDDVLPFLEEYLCSYGLVCKLNQLMLAMLN